MIFVYVLRGHDGKRYVGITNNLERRLAEHRAHHSKGGQLLGSFTLVLTEEYPDLQPPESAKSSSSQAKAENGWTSI
jgi:predicted GIY-YIG superfamily endonuclease